MTDGSPCTHSDSERGTSVVIPDGFDCIVNKVNSCCPLLPCHSVILSAKEIWFCWSQVPVLQCCCELMTRKAGRHRVLGKLEVVQV